MWRAGGGGRAGYLPRKKLAAGEKIEDADLALVVCFLREAREAGGKRSPVTPGHNFSLNI